MSSLSSSSTLAQVKNAYYDNADYDVDGDIGQARTFIVACRQLLLRLPKRGKKADDEVELDPVRIEKQLDDARSWLALNNDTAPTNLSVLHASFEEFRI